MPLRVVSAQTQSDVTRCFPVIRELRPHLSESDFVALYARMNRDEGYRLLALEEGGTIVAVMGYRYITDFIRGRHLYVDDLVATETRRSAGLGARLLDLAADLARAEGCRFMRLCTGIENDRGVSFYEKNGWTRRAYAFTRAL